MPQLTNRQWKTLPIELRDAFQLVGRYGNVAPAKQLAITKPSLTQLNNALAVVRQEVDRAELILTTYYGYGEQPSTAMSENVREIAPQSESVEA